MSRAQRDARSRVLVALLLVVGIALPGCVTPKPVVKPVEPAVKPVEKTVRQTADEVVAALTAHDGAKLAALVHPAKGVRFSAYAHVDVDEDVVFMRAQVSAFWQDRTVYEWGFTDGKGDPIRMTPSRYFERYILDRDFARATSVSENNDKAVGNTINNAAEAYPDGTRVEYYLEPDPSMGQGEMEWRALRLVLEKSGGTWYLVGIIHDEWTI